MGCCCSCCCRPKVDLSTEYLGISKTPSLQATSNQARASRASQDFRAASPIPLDEPPPYEGNPRSSVFGSRDTLDQINTANHEGGNSSSQEVKTLPWVIPLTTAGTGAKPDDSLAAAYAPDFQSAGISASQYLEFLSGLDQGLFASPNAQPGSVSAYINSMFQHQASSSSSEVAWHSRTTTESIARSMSYIAEMNQQLFHQAQLHVEVVGTDDMKRKIDAISETTLTRAEGQSKLDEIESKRAEKTLKLEQKLLTSRTLEGQQRVMRKFLEMDEKYNRKVKAVSLSKGRTEQAPSINRISISSDMPREEDGVYWLLVTRYQDSASG